MEKIIISMIFATIGIIIAAIFYIFLYKKYLKLALQKKEEYCSLENNINNLIIKQKELTEYIQTGEHLVETLHCRIDDAEKILKDLNQQCDKSTYHLNNLNQIIEQRKNQLDEEYTQTAQKYQNKLQHIKESCEAEATIVQFDLESLKKTRHIAIEQWRKQEQEQAQLDGYKLNITVQDKKDIQLLKNIQLQFSHPRVISKLIWQTYFQPLAKQQFIMILGNTTKCGIYKITNINNHKCYIGQSVDIYKRWCDHCKCGCGMDTPKNNKLYAAMLEDGVENFTFELLEECPREELNKKETFYINLYESNDYGYNTTKGND